MVFLTSTGFTNPQVYELINKNSIKKIKRACIITTATIPLKEKNAIVINTFNFLQEKGINRIEFVDIEYDDPYKLLDYELVFIMGGDSSHLLYQIKHTGTDKILTSMIHNKLNIVGASAGAMLLSSGNIYTKEFNQLLCIEESISYYSKGLKLTNDILFPHYDMLINKIPDLEKKLCEIERKNNIKITRLKNMDFIYLDNDFIRREYINP